MNKIKVNSFVKDGKLSFNTQLIKDAIKSFENKEISVTIERKKKTRSNQQNAYYWRVIVPIWQNIIKTEWQEHKSKEETHSFLKYHCNYIEKVNENTGEVFKLAKSTTKNSTIEQEEFQEKARNLAFEMFGVLIPLPNEQTEIKID